MELDNVWSWIMYGVVYKIQVESIRLLRQHHTGTCKINGNFQRSSTVICTSLLLELRWSNSNIFCKSQYKSMTCFDMHAAPSYKLKTCFHMHAAPLYKLKTRSHMHAAPLTQSLHLQA